MSYTPQLSDEDFLQQFEDLSLPAEQFNHIGHLRLAWLYLNQLPLAEAMDKISHGIQTYACSLGAKDKFHATITNAIVKIMAARMSQQESVCWQSFVQHNPDLVEGSLNVLYHYYSPQHLNQPLARIQILQPDLQAIAYPA